MFQQCSINHDVHNLTPVERQEGQRDCIQQITVSLDVFLEDCRHGVEFERNTPTDDVKKHTLGCKRACAEIEGTSLYHANEPV